MRYCNMYTWVMGHGRYLYWTDDYGWHIGWGWRGTLYFQMLKEGNKFQLSFGSNSRSIWGIGPCLDWRLHLDKFSFFCSSYDHKIHCFKVLNVFKSRIYHKIQLRLVLAMYLYYDICSRARRKYQVEKEGKIQAECKWLLIFQINPVCSQARLLKSDLHA